MGESMVVNAFRNVFFAFRFQSGNVFKVERIKKRTNSSARQFKCKKDEKQKTGLARGK